MGHRLAGLLSPATVKVPEITFDGSRGVICGCCPPTDNVTVAGFMTQAGGLKAYAGHTVLAIEIASTKSVSDTHQCGGRIAQGICA